MVGGEAVIKRREDRADRSGVDAAIGVATDAAIDRTGIQARPAADAEQTFAERAAENLGTAVVENDEVKLIRAVDLTGLARAGDELRVDRQFLPGRSAGKHLQEV